MNQEERFIELWNDYLEGELDESGLTELRQLLAEDDRRLQIAADSYRTHRLLGLHVQDTKSAQDQFVEETIRRLPTEGEGIVDAVMRQLPPGKTRRPSIRIAKWLAAVAACIFLLVGAYLLAPRTGSEIATITKSNGIVRWTGDGGQVLSNLEAGNPLHGGTLESLSEDSWAEFTFHDGSVVTLSGRSTLTISETHQKELHLREGNMSADVAPQRGGRPMLINTPTAKLEILGTRFDIEAAMSSTTLHVNEGQVRVTRLADGKIVKVGADQQVVASASGLTEFKATRRPPAVSSWQSSLPADAGYGKWVPDLSDEEGYLQTAPMLLSYQKDPVTLYVASLPVSRNSAAPVVLDADGKFRIRGHIKTTTDIYFGLTTKHVKGGFAGKYVGVRRSVPVQKEDEHLEIELHVTEFRPQEKEFADLPIGLELLNCWCFTHDADAELSITSVELLPAGASDVVKPAAEPPSLPIADIWSAVAQGNLEAVRRHLAAGVEIDAIFVAPGVPGSGATPLHLAVLSNHREIAKYLIDKGANLNAKARDEYGGTPLHWAAALGRFETARLLIESGADVNAADNSGFTPSDATNYNPKLPKEAKLKVTQLIREKGGKTAKQLQQE